MRYICSPTLGSLLILMAPFCTLSRAASFMENFDTGFNDSDDISAVGGSQWFQAQGPGVYTELVVARDLPQFAVSDNFVIGQNSGPSGEAFASHPTGAGLGDTSVVAEMTLVNGDGHTLFGLSPAQDSGVSGERWRDIPGGVVLLWTKSFGIELYGVLDSGATDYQAYANLLGGSNALNDGDPVRFRISTASALGAQTAVVEYSTDAPNFTSYTPIGSGLTVESAYQPNYLVTGFRNNTWGDDISFFSDGSGGPPPNATVFTWNLDNSGDWNVANWMRDSSLGDITPNANNHTAIFGDVMTTPQTVFSNSPVTVNQVQFDNSIGYVIAGQGSVNFEATTAASPVAPGMTVAQGSHQFQLPVNLNSSGVADIASGASLEFVNRLSLNNQTLTKTGDGTLLVNSSFNTGGGTIINNGGTISGGGTVGGSLENTGGTVAPGNSPGILTVSGNYTQGASATLAIEVASDTGPGTGHDQLAVNGDASLDGTLDIATDSGFTPGVGASPGVVGDTYVIVTASSRSGEFATVNGRHVGAGIFYDVQYNATNVALGAFQAAVGDTDGDRDVDITDFNTLSGNFDPNGNNAPHEWTDADFDGDDDIDITDFNGLSANFAPGGYAASGGQVPEPGTLILLLLGSLIWLGRSLRK